MMQTQCMNQTGVYKQSNRMQIHCNIWVTCTSSSLVCRLGNTNTETPPSNPFKTYQNNNTFGKSSADFSFLKSTCKSAHFVTFLAP